MCRKRDRLLIAIIAIFTSLLLGCVGTIQTTEEISTVISPTDDELVDLLESKNTVTIILDEKRYVIPAGTNISGNITLVGKGIAKTTITCEDRTDGIDRSPTDLSEPVLIINEGSIFHASGVTFAYTGTIPNANVIEVLGGLANFDSCRLTGGKSTEEAIAEAAWLGKGLLISGESTVTISNSIIDENQDLGIFVLDNASLNISGSTFIHDKGGALLTITKGKIRFQNCDVTLEEATIGLIINDTLDVIIQDCTIHKNQDGGIVFTGTSAGTIINNEIFDNTDSEVNNGHGILLYDSSNAIITGNAIYGHGQKGIVVMDSSGATITGNNISDNGDYGILVEANANVEITDNTISRSGVHGIILSNNAEAIIKNNIVSQSATWGVFVEEEATAMIEANLIDNNTDGGIYYDSTVSGFIRENTISNSPLGIYYRSTAILEGNSFENNGTDMIMEGQ